MIWLFNTPFELPASFWTTGNNNCLSNDGGKAQVSLISVCGGNVLGGSNRSKLPLIPVKVGVLDNICESISVTNVDTPSPRLRTGFLRLLPLLLHSALLLSSSLPYDYNPHEPLRNLNPVSTNYLECSRSEKLKCHTNLPVGGAA